MPIPLTNVANEHAEDAVTIPPPLWLIVLALIQAFFGTFMIGVIVARYSNFPLGCISLSMVAGVWTLTFLATAWESAVTIVIFRSGVIHVVRPSDRLFRRRLRGVSVYRDGVDATLHIRPGAGKGRSVVHVNILNSRKRWQQRRVAIVTTVSLPSWVQRLLPKERPDVPANS